MTYRTLYAQKLFCLIKRLEEERYPNHEQLTNMRIEYRAMISDQPMKAINSNTRHKFRNLGGVDMMRGWKAGVQNITC